ncbi:MAG: histidinol dehydrogenase [Nitrospirota bacterium]|nr:histidinol dehydrogenase [Nitrospirota bacterium]
MKIVSSSDPQYSRVLRQVCQRSVQHNAKTNQTVKQILQSVERSGDAAVVRYVRKFDGIQMRPKDFPVSRVEIQRAYAEVSKEELQALRFATRRIRAFHQRQKVKTWVCQEKGVKLGQIIAPLDAVGLYVPGGKALYPSTVLMNALPAKVAGVPRVVMCSPTSTGDIHPYLLVAADMAGVDEIYRVGGVQAIGAMAYGTQTIPRVDKIVGPGNMYVAAAKRAVYGILDIDMIAGPSELLVIADQTADPRYCAADLLCEAEHDQEAQVYLVTASMRMAKAVVAQVRKQLKTLSRKDIATHSVNRYAVAFVVPDMDEAAEVANAIAAEHVELQVAQPFEYVKKIRHAGAIFLGKYTPPAVADYVAGPNHVLPTGGSARFFSALSLHDFVKRTNLIAFNKNQLRVVKPYVTRLAGMEGFQAHAHSIESRDL